ncbi:Hypothetical protein GbCGDNIH9_5036 [Granulibacter bethesdensis]|uniref:Uncharacterized protein n=1 Tax=Granulibacter bethesdensis TaxID=364410 RepID=A0AAC9KC01_9PROT|nr:Hypothetical protein GbCGDNIH9_5036 [Granulibacter bethesdensis]APH63247.1 Hypothetical protein GbCGDNIH8_5036 [Granulibacter bethesdensis]
MKSLKTVFSDSARKPDSTESRDTKVVQNSLAPYLNGKKPSFEF